MRGVGMDYTQYSVREHKMIDRKTKKAAGIIPALGAKKLTKAKKTENYIFFGS